MISKATVRDRLSKTHLFDAVWYEQQYADVAQSKLSPIDHYLKYGVRLQRDPSSIFSTFFYQATYQLNVGKIPDWTITNPVLDYLEHKPQPNPLKVLTVCDQIMRRGQAQKAIYLADTYMSGVNRNTLNILYANEAILRGDTKQWLDYLNRYLSVGGLSPLKLNTGRCLIEKFATQNLPIIKSGPKISVIMPAWNAEKTIEAAICSILNQTWRNIELIIIDDASTDRTWQIIKRLARRDSRIKTHQNSSNRGPYVSKNIGLRYYATGNYITGQDSDDWSHPQRLEAHYKLAMEYETPVSITHMLRIKDNGLVTKIDPISSFSYDGVARKSSISCFFETKFMRKILGYWDGVAFGADTEMIARAEKAACGSFRVFPLVNMLCLDLPNNLTNDPLTGIKADAGGISISRIKYKEAWLANHKEREANSDWYLNPVI